MWVSIGHCSQVQLRVPDSLQQSSALSSGVAHLAMPQAKAALKAGWQALHWAVTQGPLSATWLSHLRARPPTMPITIL